MLTFKKCKPPSDPNTKCFCWENFATEDAWAHKGGEQHPGHYECLKKWVDKHLTCPSCRAPAIMEVPSQWKKKSITCLKYTASALAVLAMTSGYIYQVAKDGGTPVAQVVTSRWIQAAAGCALLAVQQQFLPRRLHHLRSWLTAASMFVGLNAGAAIGAAAHSKASGVEPSAIGGIVGIGTTILATTQFSSPKLAVLSSAVTGLASTCLACAGVKQGLTGTFTGAVTGGLAVGLSAIAIPMSLATARFLHYLRY